MHNNFVQPMLWSTLRFGVASPLYPKLHFSQSAPDKGVRTKKSYVEIIMKIVVSLAVTLFFLVSCTAQPVKMIWPNKIHYRYAEVKGQKIFYREAGESNSPTIVLLHGYPSSSHTYRELIPLLSGRYHIIAPDNLGSGLSDKPDADEFEYSFDVLAEHVDGLLKSKKIDKFVLYMQDFGAPVGYRVMMKNPERVQAIIAQNANAYIDGISSERQAFFNNAQLDKSSENVAKLFQFTSPEAVKNNQYLRDVQDQPEIMSPDSWIHDNYFLSSEKERSIQVKLIQDYKTNLDAYPLWQNFLRQNQFPLLLVWGKKDPVFTAEGAKAYLRDVPDAELHLLDAGHFAVEEKAVEIAQYITSFLGYEGAEGTIIKQSNATLEDNF
jgi:pimeloyl-ACP methyl ester carboxylesterase